MKQKEWLSDPEVLVKRSRAGFHALHLERGRAKLHLLKTSVT